MTPGLSEFTRMSRYALRVGNRRETWREQVDRKFGMHEDFYGSRLKDIAHPFQSARDMMLDRKVLGSQRALQFGGQPILEKNSRILNCWGSFLCYPRCFQEIFWILLCGGGVGFSVQQHHIAMLPQIRRRSDDAVTYVIPDTIEGWADSLGVLLSSYFVDDQPFPEFAGKKVVFDASGIRAKGAPISSGSLAPGPEPLLRSLVEIERILENLVQPPGGHSVSLRPIQAYDIVMHASDAVLAGGVRRSASIALFSLTDKEMATAKTGNWFFDNPQRQRSNNSALLLRGETTYEQFRELVECTRQDGDPGFFWADNTEIICNPCAEITFNPVINVGSSRPIVFNGQDSGIVHHGDGSYSVAGFQACNLSTINGSECRDEEDFIEACSAAAVLGTLQAGYTEFDYLGGYTEQIVEREALLGVSITGMADSPFLFSEELLQAGADEVNRTNALIADSIGINRASRTTTLKPEGSSSCLLDTASGIHPWHSRRGIRHVREADVSPELRWFKAHNPHAVLPDWGDPNASTEVIGFAYEAPVGAYTKQTTSALDLLEKVRLVQNSWIRHGTHPNRLPYPWLSHNVSNTVNVREHEWNKVARYVYDHRQDFGGVTFLSHSGDKTWRQAPFVAVHTEEELNEIYGYPLRTVLVQLLFELPEELNLWNACDLASQNWQSPEMQDLPLDQFDWVRMLASVVAKEDVDVLIAIKDVYYLQRYDLLTDNYAPVPWKDMLVVEDQNFLEVSACDGGACQIDWARLNAK